jgi:Tol biopolymer transport system component
MCFRFCLIVFLALGAAFTTHAADKRNITEKDLFDFVWVGDAQVSPDGGRVAFVRVGVNEKKEGYNTSIWMVSTLGNEAPHRLTTGERDSSPRWSPDGKYVVFTRSTEKDGKPEPAQLCMLSMAGGDAFTFTSLPKGAGDPKWSPDGKLIVFTSSSNPEDLEKKKRKDEEQKRGPNASPSPSPEPPKKSEADNDRESDVHVVTRAVYRSNDEGYLDFKRPQHFWTVTAPHNPDEKVQPKQLTRGRFDEDGAVWSKDGAQIYFTTLHNDEPYYDLQKTELYSISANGGEPVKITTLDMDIGAMALSPDGKQVAFTASVEQPVNSYTQPDLWVLDLAKDAKPRNLTEKFDWDVGSSVFGDNGSPRAGAGISPSGPRTGKVLWRISRRKGAQILGFSTWQRAQ